MAKTQNSWKCLVCGYIHQGDGPPDVCPVCGSPSDEFESYTDAEAVLTPASTGSWQCMVCGYINEGEGPPEFCPDCGASSDCFEALEQKDIMPAHGAGGGKVIVVGAGIAGISAVEELRSNNPSAKIILYSKEQSLPYYRLNLTRYLAGEISDDDLPIHPEAWYKDNEVQLVGNIAVTSINPEKQTINLSNGETGSFDKLILTAGAHPFVPPLQGGHREGIISFRNVTDAKRILEMAKAGTKCVCIGGGILGLETAAALAKRGADVTVIEGSPWLMPRQLNHRGGEILKEHIESLGVKLFLNARVSEIVGDENVCGVSLQDGTVLDAGLAITTSGIRSNSYLARQANLEVNRGIVVNNYLETSHPNIWAAGDVAEHRGIVYGIWPASKYQGSIAGMNASGLKAQFAGIPRSNTLKVLGIDMVSIGIVMPEDGSYQVFEQDTDGKYLQFIFHDSYLLGALMIGDTTLTAAAKTSIEKKTSFSGLLKKNITAIDIAAYLADNFE